MSHTSYASKWLDNLFMAQWFAVCDMCQAREILNIFQHKCLYIFPQICTFVLYLMHVCILFWKDPNNNNNNVKFLYSAFHIYTYQSALPWVIPGNYRVKFKQISQIHPTLQTFPKFNIFLSRPYVKVVRYLGHDIWRVTHFCLLKLTEMNV